MKCLHISIGYALIIKAAVMVGCRPKLRIYFNTHHSSNLMDVTTHTLVQWIHFHIKMTSRQHKSATERSNLFEP